MQACRNDRYKPIKLTNLIIKPTSLAVQEFEQMREFYDQLSQLEGETV